MNTTNSTSTALFPPDSDGVKVAMWTTMFLFVAYSVALVVMLLIRRNHQPVRVRVPALLIVHVCNVCFMLILTHVRIIAGREIFPCFIYTFTYYFAIPEISFPHLLRMFRFILVFKLSKQITQDAYQTTAKVFRALLTRRFLLLLITLVALLHLVLWIACMGIVTAIDKVNQFSVQGCRLGSNSYFVLSIVVVYLLLLLIMIIAIITQVKDTWNIRLEVIVVGTMWLIACVIFCVLNFLPSYISCCEFTAFPAGYVILIAAFLDTFITCALPVILSFRRTRNADQNQVADREVLFVILNNDKYREQFKGFAVKSFCPESIIFWEEAQIFAKLTNDDDREIMIREMYDKFLSNEAPIELNLGDKTKIVSPVMNAAHEYREKGVLIPTTILDALIIHVCEDMMDVFCRYQLQSGWAVIEKEMFDAKKEFELMTQAGMLSLTDESTPRI